MRIHKAVAIALALGALVAAVFLLQHRSRPNGDKIDILLTNGTVLTMDGQLRVFEHGWVAIDNGVIVALGTGTTSYKATQTIDARGGIIMPGLINTHAHTATTVLRGTDDHDQLADWLEIVNKYEQKLTPEDVYWATQLGSLEMIASGTTTVNDMYFNPEQSADAFIEQGMRAVVRIPIVVNGNSLQVDTEFIERYKNQHLLSLAFAPNPLIDFSPAELQEALQQLDGIPYITHVHIESEPKENDAFVERWHLRPLEILKQSGLLNGPIVLAHSIFFSDQELQELASYKTATIAMTPKSEYKLTDQRSAPLETLLNDGVNVSLGTDGVISSTSLDMFAQMNFTALALGRCHSSAAFCEQHNNISPQTIVSMATRNAAQALGLENKIGSLEVGKDADIIVLDTSTPAFQPRIDPYTAIVYFASGSDVSQTIIDGKVVYSEKNYKIAHKQEIISHAQAISDRIRAELQP